MIRNHSNDIETDILIQTSVIDRLKMKAHVNLTQPKIVQEELIDFGLNEINRNVYKKIKIVNPTD